MVPPPLLFFLRKRVGLSHCFVCLSQEVRKTNLCLVEKVYAFWVKGIIGQSSHVSGELDKWTTSLVWPGQESEIYICQGHTVEALSNLLCIIECDVLINGATCLVFVKD